MTSVLERIPEHVKAGLLDRVLQAQHPKLALPTIASNAHMTLTDLQVVLNRYGYPDRARMAKARDELILRAEADEPDHAELMEQRQREHLVPGAPADGPAERLAQIPVADLQSDPDNPREKILDTDVEELADSIAEVGLLQPIVARQTPRGLVVVAGHRRLAAVKLLGWTKAPVIVRADMRPDHVLAAMLIENGQRRDLDPIEEARGLKKLKELDNLTDIDLAKKVGRSQQLVSSRLALLLLSPDDQDRVRSGQLGLTQATNLGRLNGGKVRKHKPHRDRENHFGSTHELARLVAARCKRLGHTSKVAGGMGCGECWESVIRADERDDLQKRLARTGNCPTCE